MIVFFTRACSLLNRVRGNSTRSDLCYGSFPFYVLAGDRGSLGLEVLNRKMVLKLWSLPSGLPKFRTVSSIRVWPFERATTDKPPKINPDLYRPLYLTPTRTLRILILPVDRLKRLKWLSKVRMAFYTRITILISMSQ